MATSTADPLIVVRLNDATDELGRPLGMLRGYQPGDKLTPAVLFRMPVDDTETGVAAALEHVFMLLNVGDDREFMDPPSEVAVRYRARGCRSLSVGDVVEVFGDRFAVASFGFRKLT